MLPWRKILSIMSVGGRHVAQESQNNFADVTDGLTNTVMYAESVCPPTYLCGQDGLTGRSFEHRREWIRARLELLAGQFGIEVLGFVAMKNHCTILGTNGSCSSRMTSCSPWDSGEYST
jgi:hypothetical protein